MVPRNYLLHVGQDVKNTTHSITHSLLMLLCCRNWSITCERDRTVLATQRACRHQSLSRSSHRCASSWAWTQPTKVRLSPCNYRFIPNLC